MSLIIFKDETLCADRSGVELEPLRRFVEFKKLYIHPDRSFALATTGSVMRMESPEFKEFIDYLYQHLRVLDELIEGSIPFPSSKFKMENRWFVITKKHFYVSVPTKTGEEINGFDLTRVDRTEDYYVGGSGCYTASVFLDLKFPIAEVFHKTSLIESEMFPTVIDCVTMKSLKPFRQNKIKFLIQN